MRTEHEIRECIKDAESTRESEKEKWERHFMRGIIERPDFNIKIRGVDICNTNNEMSEGFVLGMRYALGEVGIDNE